jgi:hypothetical protein
LGCTIGMVNLYFIYETSHHETEHSQHNTATSNASTLQQEFPHIELHASHCDTNNNKIQLTLTATQQPSNNISWSRVLWVLAKVLEQHDLDIAQLEQQEQQQEQQQQSYVLTIVNHSNNVERKIPDESTLIRILQ